MSAETSGVNSQNICGLCDEKSSKYCCPRCSVFYCSLDCYKSEKHLNCSESFYKDCVNEELVSYQADDESKRKMVEILKKMQNEDLGNPEDIEEMLKNIDESEEVGDDEGIDSDDDEGIDLHDRIKDLNLDDPDALWNALTEDERNEFEALLNQGDVGTIIPQWQPWWMYHKEEKLVEDVDDKDKTKEDVLKDCPPLVKVAKFTDLTTVKPSPAIRFNIANVLAAYAFTTRYFNGELDPVEGTVYLLSICSNLDGNTNFEDPAIAVEAVAQKCLQSELIETDEASLEVMKDDVFQILKGPSKDKKAFYCKAALSHLHKIFSEAKTAGKLSKNSKDNSDFSRKFPEHTREHLPNLDVSKVKKCIKKIEYYLSFVESYGQESE
ncbi:hypothetical protein ABMA28_008889 [Loxostege sticticalis]|uniref:HIT-type domain-containing protein n=1 Tax=Loxostege sticticalis TaxID=481309 RepID=A0ABD0SF08_LOXSC